MLKLLRENLVLFLLTIVIVLTFWSLPKTFYQQDEWQSLGYFLAQGPEDVLRHTTPLGSISGEGRPLSGIFYLVFLGGFKLDVVPITIFAVSNHLFNTFLVFLLANKISKNKYIGLFAASLFALNSVSHQAVTWISAVTTLPTTSLILLSLITYLRFLGSNKKKDLYISFVFGAISLFIKETGVFLFISFPIIYFIYRRKANFKEFFNLHLPLIIYGALFLLTRLTVLFLRTEKVAGFVGGGENFIQLVIFHSVLYPLTSLFQIYIPPLDLYSITPAITKMQYKFLVGSPLTDLVAQSVTADMISILGAMVILGVLLLISIKSKDKTANKNILFALALFFLSFLPYAVLNRDSSYLSSRYFYVGAVGAGILFGYIIYFLSNLNKYSKWIVLPLVFIFLFHHASTIRSDINYQVKLGNERKAVLNGIKTLKPTLDDKTIFYITSDKEYYGPITNPFQNGLGYVLQIVYYDSGKVPKEFLSENFLWDLGSQGYRELGNKGFGYFQNIDKMAKKMEKNNLRVDSIHAFFIRSSDTKVLDITSDVRTRISTISAITK